MGHGRSPREGEGGREGRLKLCGVGWGCWGLLGAVAVSRYLRAYLGILEGRARGPRGYRIRGKFRQAMGLTINPWGRNPPNLWLESLCEGLPQVSYSDRQSVSTHLGTYVYMAIRPRASPSSDLSSSS